MTMADLYLYDMVEWGKKHGWEYRDGKFISSTGQVKTVEEFYKLWKEYGLC